MGLLGDQYNQYVQGAKDYYAQQKTANYDTLNSSLDKNYSDAISFNNGKDFGGFNAQYAPTAQVQGSQVDLSKVTPFLNFQDVQNDPNSNLFNKFAPTTTLTPQDQYLGYKAKQKDTDPRNQYLYAKSS